MRSRRRTTRPSGLVRPPGGGGAGGPLRRTVAGLHLSSPWRTAAALAARPGLWPTAALLAWRTGERRRPGGRARRPLPSGDYLAFRAEAMLGGVDGGGGGDGRGLHPDEVVDYLAWCRRMRRLGG